MKILVIDELFLLNLEFSNLKIEKNFNLFSFRYLEIISIRGNLLKYIKKYILEEFFLRFAVWVCHKYKHIQLYILFRPFCNREKASVAGVNRWRSRSASNNRKTAWSKNKYSSLSLVHCQLYYTRG